MESLRIFTILIICLVSAVEAQQAIFNRYEIRFEYRAVPGRRSVTSVASNLTASGTAPSRISASPDSRLWKATLYASNDAEGTNQLEVFPSVMISQYQAAQDFIPGGLLRFFIGADLDMDASLADYKYLCLQMEKDPTANPDFEFVYGPDDEVTLCREIDFAGVPHIEYPEELQARSQAIFNRYEIQFEYRAVPGRRSVTSVASNLTASGIASSRISASPDSRLWKATLYASNDAEGTNQLEVFPSVMISQYQAAQDFIPGGLLRFFIGADLDMDASLANYMYLCLKMEKDPAANPDFEFVYGPDDEVTLCREIDFAGVPQIEYPEELQARSQAIFDSYEIQFEYAAVPGRRTVTSVASKLTASGTAPSRISASPDSRLWKATLYASNDAKGTSQLEVFPSVMISQDQAAQDFTPGGLLQFSIPVDLDMDATLADYTYLCLQMEKDPAANPDFEFVYGPDDEVTLCREIDFAGVPQIEYPEELQVRSQAIFDSYEIQFEYAAVPGRRTVTSVASKLTASGTAPSRISASPDSRLWKATLYASNDAEGTSQLEVFPSVMISQDQAAQDFTPGGLLQFSIPVDLDMDATLADYTYLCLQMEKDPAANPDFEFVYGPNDEVILCRGIDFAGVPQIEYPEELQARSQAIFDSYEIQFEYAAVPGRRTVTSVASKLTASGTAPSRISASPDSRLWKATLYASNDAEGTSQLEVFPSVMISQDQATQDFTPGGLLQFSIPVDLDMDATLADYTYLCLQMEKDPAANPDFEFVYGPDDEVTLCREIDFAGVPQTPVLDPLERIRRQVEITDVSVNTTFMQPDKSSPSVLSTVYYNMHFGGSTDVIEGEDVWMIRFFVSETDDGRGEKRLISTTLQGSAATTLTPDTDKTFKAFVSLEYTGFGPGTDYPYACVIFAKHPTTDVDITFSGNPTATECVELPEIIVESQQLELPEVHHTCRLWGDPHQVTFDTYGYTHQGDAEYIAVTTCFNEDESVPNFEVVVDNFRKKPSIPVTYIREHRLYYNDVVYALTHPDDVSVDGERVTLPYIDAENGIKIHYAAPHKILTTDFGLTIRFDNMHNSDITLPERFMNKVCGLCGNYDGERSNECHYRNGTLMNQHNEDCKLIHADEWIFETPDLPYPTDFQPALRQCDEGSPYLDMAMEHCGILTDTAGPLAVCHNYVDPEIYFNTCKFDVCQLLPEVFFLCGSVETYIYACGRESNWQAEVGDWRAVATTCEPPCKGNMTFDPRGPPCPPSCADPEGSSASCKLHTLEMCFCPEGTLLDGIECVPEEECGCKMANGRYLSIGEQFMKRDCSEYCTCEGNGDLQCHELSCAFNAHCAVKGGVRNCYCDDGFMGNGREECSLAGKVCHIYGDPHFHTFDEDFYSFQGDCTYVAVETCKDPPEGSPPFTLLIHNDALIPEERFTYLTMVRLHFAGNTFKLKYTGEVLINDYNFAGSLPYSNDHVEITKSGKYITLVTSFGLKITYDGENDAEISLPPNYFGKVCGLCGNADGNSTNDKQMRDGTLAKKLDFANSWGVGHCPTIEKPVQTCEPDTKEYNTAVDICSEIANTEGSFAHCHAYKSPFSFITSCIFDLCGTLPSTDLFCSSAVQYLKACAEKGGIFDADWESKVKYCGDAVCTDGYTNYKQSCYKFVPDRVTYKAAKDTCEAEGAHLVTISSRAENMFVSDLGESERLWLGATRNTSATFSAYESAADDTYTLLPDRLTRGIGSFRFSVKSHSEAHLLLSSTKDIDDNSPLYEIVLGAERNKLNLLRRCQACSPRVEQRKPYLHKRRFRDFFVNFHEGKIQVGDMKNRELILEYKDPLPMRVRYIGFKSVSRVGSWKFYETEYMWDTEESWNFDNFRYGEPSNYESEERCLETNFLHPGLWNDHFCSEEKAFICEIDGY